MQDRLIKLRNLKQYPSLLAGSVLIAILLVLAFYTLIALPYDEAIRLWRGGPGVWDDNPQNAGPVWLDLFTRDRLPRTIVVTSDIGTGTEEATGDGMKRIEITLPFQYTYDGFPKELKLFTQSVTGEVRTSMTVSWHAPEGRTIVLQEDRLITASDIYYISQDAELRAQLSGIRPEVGLLADPQDKEKALKGDYQLVLSAELPDTADLNAKLVVYGQVHGLAGTDHRRRDLMVALLWGIPVALVFGLLAAVGTTLVTFFLSAMATWVGGKTDRALQWLTQVNLIIPLLPVLIMVGYLYSRSIWTMLGLVIALNILGSSMLTYRAMFLQAKESPFIEAATAYGAGNLRIIFRYLMPRLAPTLLPQFVLIVPTFVFLEATLAVLGLGDPVLPTWGKVLEDAVHNGALYTGLYYWVLEPAILLMTVGIGFSLIGYSLDRIFNPRLRVV